MVDSAGTGNIGALLGTLGGSTDGLQFPSSIAAPNSSSSLFPGDKVEISDAGGYRVVVQKAVAQLMLQATWDEKAKDGSTVHNQVTVGIRIESLIAQGVKDGAEAGDGSGAVGSSMADKINEMFGPEATSKRIFSFAVGQYNRWLKGAEDSPEARAQFADFIKGAIDDGFKQAQGILGVLPDQVQTGIDKTHDLVWKMFDEFIDKGFTGSPEDIDAAFMFRQKLTPDLAAAIANEGLDVLHGGSSGEQTPGQVLDAVA